MLSIQQRSWFKRTEVLLGPESRACHHTKVLALASCRIERAAAMVLPVSVPGTREGRLSPSRLGLRRSCFRSVYRSHAPTLTDLAFRAWRPWDKAAGHKVCITVLRAAVQVQSL
jgi:hypothetical protein